MKQNQSETDVQQKGGLISIEQILHNVWAKGLSAAYYRLPKQNIKYLLVDLSAGHKVVDPELETITPGFIFGAFDHSPNAEVWYINADIIIKEEDGICQLVSRPDKSFYSEIDDLIYNYTDKSSEQIAPYFINHDDNRVSTTHSEYTDIVQAAVDQIEKGIFQKVVPARQMHIDLSKAFKPLQLFDNLCVSYPNTFVSLVTTPETGTWIGASPEILIAIDANNKFNTTALAGTQPHREDVQLTDVAWTQKDIEEQAMVSRYIINCFKKIRLREFDEIGPKTNKTGNLIHLKTNYTVDLNRVDFLHLGSVMLKLLHPTSAVCGLPEAPATRFIQETESFDRAFFSGYLGPVNMNDETHVYVNIRCMNLLEDAAILYAGAGVTIDSNPEKEWLETEIKLNTLLDLI